MGADDLSVAAVAFPNALADAMPILEVLHPARTGLELVVGDLHLSRDLPGFGADEAVAEDDAAVLALEEPLDELCFDLGELGRPEHRWVTIRTDVEGDEPTSALRRGLLRRRGR